MQGMLLAAGLGTRLRPLTDSLPKPAVRVAGKPLGWFALSHLARSGVEHVVVNTHYLPEVLRAALVEHCPEGLTLAFSHEPEILGTGGGVRQAREHFGDAEGPVVVMNSDTIFAPDLGRALEVHKREGAIATMVLRSTDEPERWGSVEVDGSGSVRRILGEPVGVDEDLQKFMFAGVHILSAQAFDDLPEQGCIIRHSYRKWLGQDAVVMSIVDDSPWSDVGTLEAYDQVNAAFANGTLTWPGIG